MVDRALELAPPAAAVAARPRGSGQAVLNAVYIATFVVVGLLVAVPLAALIYGSFRTIAPGIAGEWTFWRAGNPYGVRSWHAAGTGGVAFIAR